MCHKGSAKTLGMVCPILVYCWFRRRESCRISEVWCSGWYGCTVGSDLGWVTVGFDMCKVRCASRLCSVVAIEGGGSILPPIFDSSVTRGFAKFGTDRIWDSGAGWVNLWLVTKNVCWVISTVAWVVKINCGMMPSYIQLGLVCGCRVE